MDVITIVTIIIGLITCFFGYKLNKTIIAIFGLIIGYNLGVTLLPNVITDQTTIYIISVIIAIAIGLISYKLYLVGIFLLCALAAYILCDNLQLAQNIVEYRAANGNFKNRKELLNVPRLGNKAFEQCAGFLRIPDSENPLDNTAVHPENYKTVEKMASDCGCSINELINDKAKRADIDINRYVTDNTGIPTLTDIMEELDKPGRDPRTTTGIVNFDSNIKSFNDLREGIIVNGIITNITQFGVFVDIGIKENGLVHISEICNHFISSPADVVKLHQHVKVKIKNIDTQRRRLSLSMKETN